MEMTNFINSETIAYFAFDEMNLKTKPDIWIDFYDENLCWHLKNHFKKISDSIANLIDIRTLLLNDTLPMLVNKGML